MNRLYSDPNPGLPAGLSLEYDLSRVRRGARAEEEGLTERLAMLEKLDAVIDGYIAPSLRRAKAALAAAVAVNADPAFVDRDEASLALGGDILSKLSDYLVPFTVYGHEHTIPGQKPRDKSRGMNGT